MARIGFCGGAYKSQSINADNQICVNWYAETDESGLGTSQIVLYPTPGLSLFAGIQALNGDAPVRGMYFANYVNRLFAVVGAGFYEVLPNGTAVRYGILNNNVSDGSQVTMAANNAGQLLICAQGLLYLFSFRNNELQSVKADLGPFGSVEFVDGFFIARITNSQQIQISGIEDGTTWNDALVAQVSEFTDNIIGMIVNQRQVWLMGQTHSIAYYDSGAYPFPFSPIPGSLIESGLAAASGLLRADNSVFWVDQDERGSGIARRLNGYTPQRVSTHAIETKWQSYSRMDDAIGYSMQNQGHTFACWYFPTANETWCYDVATGLWHERRFWNEQRGTYTAHRSRCHVFAFGKHMVGDWASGNIYAMAISYYDDFGNPIRRARRAPHVSTEQQWMFHQELQVYVESGLGPTPPLQGGPPIPGLTALFIADQNGNPWEVTVADNGELQAVAVSAATPTYPVVFNTTGTLWQLGIDANTSRLTTTLVQATPYDAQPDLVLISPGQVAWVLLVMANGQLETFPAPPPTCSPRLMLKWSDNGGHTWSNEYPLDCGKAGEFLFRAIRRRLGRSRNRTYEISTTDAIPWRIIDAYLKATPGYAPSERLPKQLTKVQ